MERLTDEQRITLAEKILQFTHGQDIRWGHSGTCDDESWRKVERRCLDIVDTIANATLAADRAKSHTHSNIVGSVAHAYDHIHKTWQDEARKAGWKSQDEIRELLDQITTFQKELADWMSPDEFILSVQKAVQQARLEGAEKALKWAATKRIPIKELPGLVRQYLESLTSCPQHGYPIPCPKCGYTGIQEG